jgi:hypothetical protein
MNFSDLIENPPDTTLAITILGILTTQGFSATEMLLIGRLIIFFGEVIITFGALLAALEAAKPTQSCNTTAADNKNDEPTLTLNNLLMLIKQLQQENRYLQEQIWDLQKHL